MNEKLNEWGMKLFDNNKRFTAEATYYNVSANSLFMMFIGLLLTYYAWQKNGWTLLAKSLLIISLLLFIITVGLFFSKFSIRKLMIKNDTISVGKRTFSAKDVTKIECMAIGKTFHIHIAGIDETLTLRMKEKNRIQTRRYMQKWCKRYNIPFVEK